jgi:hypothetical protein
VTQPTAGALARHVPATHACEAAHAALHAPQWSGWEASVTTHAAAPFENGHDVVEPTHFDRHVLPWHADPLGHANPQPPQWRGSVVVSTQSPAHATRPGLHAHADAPLQYSPGEHDRPQPPHERASEAVSVQTPAQAITCGSSEHGGAASAGGPSASSSVDGRGSRSSKPTMRSHAAIARTASETAAIERTDARMGPQNLRTSTSPAPSGVA